MMQGRTNIFRGIKASRKVWFTFFETTGQKERND